MLEFSDHVARAFVGCVALCSLFVPGIPKSTTVIRDEQKIAELEVEVSALRRKMEEEATKLSYEDPALKPIKSEIKVAEDIWFEEERFKKLAAELESKTSNLAKVTETGDLKKIKVAFEQTRDTCNTCHKEFRKK